MAKNNGNEIVTAGRLIGYLKTLPANTPIVLSGDEEGNSYSVLTDFGVAGLTDVADLEINTKLKAKQALVFYPN